MSVECLLLRGFFLLYSREHTRMSTYCPRFLVLILYNVNLISEAIRIDVSYRVTQLVDTAIRDGPNVSRPSSKTTSRTRPVHPTWVVRTSSGIPIRIVINGVDTASELLEKHLNASESKNNNLMIALERWCVLPTTSYCRVKTPDTISFTRL